VPAGRPWSLIARNVLAAPNWRALARAPRVYERPGRSVGRYLSGRGDYPWSCGLRTPLGTVHPELYSQHDVVTVNEIFCREDYRAGRGLGLVVDVGSNIGLSALYFLTRDPGVRVRCFEPVPRNVERLRANLADFAGRWTVEEVAVDAQAGEASFGDEPYGRYGAIDLPGARHTFPVQVRGIADVVDEALEGAERIDVLKIDTEGAELRTVQAIRSDQLARIGTIYFEWLGDEALPHPGAFDATVRCDTVALRQRA
jgi:FkbM family methyltransferase